MLWVTVRCAPVSGLLAVARTTSRPCRAFSRRRPAALTVTATCDLRPEAIEKRAPAITTGGRLGVLWPAAGRAAGFFATA